MVYKKGSGIGSANFLSAICRGIWKSALFREFLLCWYRWREFLWKRAGSIIPEFRTMKKTGLLACGGGMAARPLPENPGHCWRERCFFVSREVTPRENFSVRFDPHAGILSPEHPHESALEHPCKHFFIDIRKIIFRFNESRFCRAGYQKFSYVVFEDIIRKKYLLQNWEWLFSSRHFLVFPDYSHWRFLLT